MFKDIRDIIKEIGVVSTTLYLLVLVTACYFNNVYAVTAFTMFFFARKCASKQKTYVDATCLFIILFSFFYVAINYINNSDIGFTTYITYLFSPVIFYIFGRDIVARIKSESLMISFIVITICLFAVGVYYGVIINIANTGLINLERDLKVPGQTELLSATLCGLNVSLGFAFVSVFFISRSLSIYVRILMIFGLLLSLISVIHMINRTGIAVLLLCLFAILIFWGRNNKRKLLLPIIALSIVIYALFHFGVLNDDVLIAYSERDTGNSTVGSAGGRVELWIDAFTKMWQYPLGWVGNNTTDDFYAHNMWLDIARVAGLLPFIAFVVATIMYLLNFFELLKTERNDNVRILFIAINTSFLASSFVEPVIEGLAIYFYMFMMFWGMQSKIVIHNKQVNSNVEERFL